MILSPNSESLREMNSCHAPAGSGNGGQFCSGKDGFVPAPKNGAIPRTGEQAAGEIGSAFRRERFRRSVAKGENTGNFYIRRDLDNTFEDAAKSWYTKVLRDHARPEDARPEVFKAVEAGMAANAENHRYQRVVNRFSNGQDHVIVIKSPINDHVTSLSDSSAGQRVAATSVLFDHPFLRNENFAKMTVNVEPTPGLATVETAGGMAAILRHEYGHHVYDSLRSEDTQSWRSALRPFTTETGYLNARSEYAGLRDKITYYAATNEAEAFCETFTIWTHPKYRKAAYPESVHPLFDWMDRRFGGRLIEALAGSRL